MSTAMSEHTRDHDHTAEHAFGAYVEEPTPENARAAELAIALLQRRYGHVLRRLDGADEPPEFPSHRHNAADDPVSCLEATAHELAGARLADRAETLAHALEAARALERQRDEARRWAQLYRYGMRTGIWDWDRFELDPDDEPSWLTQLQQYPQVGEPPEPPA
jgi:hypothetical protein